MYKRVFDHYFAKKKRIGVSYSRGGTVTLWELLSFAQKATNCHALTRMLSVGLEGDTEEGGRGVGRKEEDGIRALICG